MLFQQAPAWEAGDLVPENRARGLPADVVCYCHDGLAAKILGAACRYYTPR
jgi:hypothetical protein